jgi:hypothetical protein
MAIFSKWKFLALVLVIPLVVLVALACGDDDDDDGSEELDAEAQLCADLATLQAADATFDGLSSASSIDDVKAANEAYAEALDDVVSSTNDLADIRSQPIEDAYDSLDSAIDDLDSSESIADGLTAIEDELAAVDAAYIEAFSGVACPA